MFVLRWFEKTEVFCGKVYGLLNRRTLFVWSSESGDCLGKLDISDSPPGMGESNLVIKQIPATRLTCNQN